MAEASARYNIGAISRTLNTPTAALVFARAANQTRSTFEAGRRHKIRGIDTIELRFQETAMPRIIFTRDDAAASGRFWVIPETGAIVRTELRLQSAGASAVLIVAYGLDERLDLWVPLRMDERYDGSTGVTSVAGLEHLPASTKLEIEGHATYSDFRQFTVSTHVK